MIEIVEASATDIESILEFWKLAEALPTSTDDAAALGTLLDHPRAVLLLALDGSELAGTVIAGFDGWRGGIYRLAVDPGRRREGIASRLVQEAVRRLEEMGARRIAAIARTDEEQALGFWDSGAGAGFERGANSTRFVRG